MIVCAGAPSTNLKPGRVALRGQGPNFCVGRTVSENTLLLGKFRIPSRQFWGNREGVRIILDETDQEIEIVTKDETCAIPWMAYTAGQTLPAGAVIGGHLADGSHTYIAKMTIGNSESFGYYNPNNKMGYYEFHGTHTTTSMDILVLI